MRPSRIAIPAAIFLACAGGYLALDAPAAVNTAATPTSELGIDFQKKEHPVTPVMRRETGAMKGKGLPTFETTDYAGKPVRVAPPDGAKPQFVMFVLDGCPCSVDAEPLFRKLAKRHGYRVDFISITNAEPEKAREWSVRMLTPYPVVPDPQQKIIKAFGAKSSVYSALVAPDGRILKMWPGYSDVFLKEMNALMAKVTGVKETPFDPEYAPKKATTGCAFSS